MSTLPSLDTETENEINLMAEDGVNHAFIAQQLSVSRETVSKCIQIKKDLEEPTSQSPQNSSAEVSSIPREPLERGRRSMKRERDNSESEKPPMTKKGPGVSDIPRKTQRKQTGKIKIEKLQKKFNIDQCVEVTLERLSQHQINQFSPSPIFYPSDKRRRRTTAQNRAYCRKRTRVEVGIKNKKVPNTIEVPVAKIEPVSKLQEKSIEMYQSEKDKEILEISPVSTVSLDKSDVIKQGHSLGREITQHNVAKERIQQPAIRVLEETVPKQMVVTEISENDIKHMPNKQAVTKLVSHDESVIKETFQEKVLTEKSSLDQNIIKETTQQQSIKATFQKQNIIKIFQKQSIIENTQDISIKKTSQERSIKERTQEKNIIKKITQDQNKIKDMIQRENSTQGILESKNEGSQNKIAESLLDQSNVKNYSQKTTIVQETHQEEESAFRKTLQGQILPKDEKAKEPLSRVEDSSWILNSGAGTVLKGKNSLTTNINSSLKGTEYPVKKERFCKEEGVNFAFSTPKYAILDIEKLKLGFKNLVCSKCYKCVDVKFPSTIEIPDMEFQFQCSSCNRLKYFKRSQSSIDELSANSIGHDSFYMRLIFSSLDYGGGYRQMESMCMALGIPHIDLKSYKKHSDFIIQESREKLEGLLKRAGETVHKVYTEDGVQFDEEGVRNINVTYDGTWIRGGKHFKYGLVVAVDAMTGLVLDYHLMSKFCFKCFLTKKKRPQTFETWQTKHKELGHCRINYQSSPQGMEIDGALILSQRSMQRHKLRYNNISSHKEKACDSLDMVVQKILSNGKEAETHWDKEQNRDNKCTQKDKLAMYGEPCSIEQFVSGEFSDRQALPNSCDNLETINDYNSQTINSLSQLPEISESSFPQLNDPDIIEHTQNNVQVKLDSSDNVSPLISNSSQIQENSGFTKITDNKSKNENILEKEERKDGSSVKDDESSCQFHFNKEGQAKKDNFPLATEKQTTKGETANFDLKSEDKQMLNSSPMDVEDNGNAAQMKMTNLKSCKDIGLEPTLNPMIIQEVPKVVEQPSVENLSDKSKKCCSKEADETSSDAVLSPKLCKGDTSAKTGDILLEIQNLVTVAEEGDTNKPENSDQTCVMEMKQESGSHPFHHTNLESPSHLPSIMENEEKKQSLDTGSNNGNSDSLSDIKRGETNHQIQELEPTETPNKNHKQPAINLNQINNHETQDENHTLPIINLDQINTHKTQELEPMETKNETHKQPAINLDQINTHKTQELEPMETQNETHKQPAINLDQINTHKTQELEPMETQNENHKQPTINLDLMSNLVPKDSILIQPQEPLPALMKMGENWVDQINPAQESKTTPTTEVKDKDELCKRESVEKNPVSGQLGSSDQDPAIINQMKVIKKALKEIKSETLRSTVWGKCNQRKSVPWECIEFACYYAIITHNVAIQNFIKSNQF